jgi:hypothetical protein
MLDVTTGNHTPVSMSEKSIPVFAPGFNLIDMDLPHAGKFITSHMYQLSLIDKQGQEWTMLFEYKGKKK